MSILFPISRFGNNRQSNFDNIFNTFFDPLMASSSNQAGGFRNVASVPRANVLKVDEGYTIELAAPGFTRDEFEISVDNGILSVHVGTSDTKDYSEQLTMQEYSYSSFTRSWNLPEDINICPSLFLFMYKTISNVYLNHWRKPAWMQSGLRKLNVGMGH
jgi:HSP20 family protein